jgi:SAM-dependent methyltransferase
VNGIKKIRSPENPDQKYWSARWQSQQTGWDLQGPHEGLERLLQLLNVSAVLEHNEAPLVIYSPGCGRAHDAAGIVGGRVNLPQAIAARTLHIIATDFAPEAIAAARDLYGALEKIPPGRHKIEFRVEDARAEVSAGQRGTVDIIFDRAMLCALRPELRAAYLKSCHQRLRRDGIFLSLPFTKIDATQEHPPGSGPPFQITLPEMKLLMATHGFKHIVSESMPVRRASTIIREEGLTVFQSTP